ncbi:hypothetical protein EXIGLDRAFT_844819, partial [Exidia glandulosa HHB12029]
MSLSGLERLSVAGADSGSINTVMDAIVGTQLSLGDVLAGIFSPGRLSSAVHVGLVKDFLSGRAGLDFSAILNLVLDHPDAQPAKVECGMTSPSPASGTKGIAARSILVAWATHYVTSTSVRRLPTLQMPPASTLS